jgi:transcriptional regulator with XRE-family HTH domain
VPKKVETASIRRRVRIYLAEHDLTQRQLAAELDIDESYLSLIIRGLRYPPREIALRLEAKLGIPAREFLGVA